MSKKKSKPIRKYDIPHPNSKPDDQKTKAFSVRFSPQDLAIIDRISDEIGDISMIKALRYALRVTDEVIK